MRCFRITKIDQYIFEEILIPFLGSCCAILFILLMFQILRLADLLIIHDTPLFLIGKMIGFMALSLLPITLPLAFLISVLIAFGRLSSESELIAFKASGISIFRLTVPVWFFATILVVISHFLNMNWIPRGERLAKETLLLIESTKGVAAIHSGTFHTGFFDLLLFADQVDVKNNRLYRVFLFDEREPKNPLTYVSKTAEIIPIKIPVESGVAAILKLYNGSMYHNNMNTNTYEKIDFSSYQLYLKLDPASYGKPNKISLLSKTELLTKLKETPPLTKASQTLLGEYWRRYATVISPFIFSLFGIGFGTFRHRTHPVGAVLLGVSTLICYWLLQMLGTLALQRNLLPPFIAMQISNAVILLIGLLRFRTILW